MEGFALGVEIFAQFFGGFVLLGDSQLQHF
jgi:hypothetical protein